MYNAREYKALSRRLTTFEYEKVIAYFFEIGLKNGFMQKRSSATSDYTPTFDLSGVATAESFIKREENTPWLKKRELLLLKDWETERAVLKSILF